MESGAIRHLVSRAAGCMLFFGLVAPPLGGVLMLLLMLFGTGELVGASCLAAGDVLGMVVFIGAFSYAIGFLPACLVGAIVGAAQPGMRRLRWFLLLCAVLSAVVPGLLNGEQRIFGALAVLPGVISGLLWWRRARGGASHDDASHDPLLP